MTDDINRKIDLTLEPSDFPYSKQIDQILDYFDAASVVRIMKAEGMKWVTRDPKSGNAMLATPTSSMIRTHARRMLEECAMRLDDISITSSAFLVIKLGERLALYFITARGDTFGDVGSGWISVQ